MTDTTSTDKHTAAAPMYPGRPLIWTDPDTNKVIIGTHDGDAVFALNDRQAKDIIDMLSSARQYAVSQQDQDDYLYRYNRSGAESQFRKDYIADAGDDIDIVELNKATQEFLNNYDHENRHN